MGKQDKFDEGRLLREGDWQAYLGMQRIRDMPGGRGDVDMRNG